MKVIDYLKECYCPYEPIFLKDIRIGRKSSTAIRKELSRAVDSGDLIRSRNGVYALKSDEYPTSGVTFESIVERKFIKDDFGFPQLNLNVYGYYSGYTFLNQLGVSHQVPAVIEIVTNNTSCKREYIIGKRKAVIRKGRINIDRFNYKALQFFDAINIMENNEIKENKDLLKKYIENNLSIDDFEKYIGLYKGRVLKLIVDEGFIDAFKSIEKK